MVLKVIDYSGDEAVVLPSRLLDSLGVPAGSYADVEVKDGRLIIRPRDPVAILSEADRKWVQDFYKQHEEVFKALAE